MEGIHQGTASAFHQGKRTTKLPQENVLSPHIFPGQKSCNILLELTTQKIHLQFLSFLQPSHPHELVLAPTPSSAHWICVLCTHCSLRGWTPSSKGKPNSSRQNTPLGERHKAVFQWHEFQDDRGFGHECVQTPPEKNAMTTSVVSAPWFCWSLLAHDSVSSKYMWNDDRFYPWAVQALQTSGR